MGNETNVLNNNLKFKIKLISGERGYRLPVYIRWYFYKAPFYLLINASCDAFYITLNLDKTIVMKHLTFLNIILATEQKYFCTR